MSAKHSASVPAGERLAVSLIGELKDAIESAGGNEIFAIGHLDAAGLVDMIDVVARGTSDAVPAIQSYFEKGSVLIHNHPSGHLMPSDADVSIAAEAGSYGVGSYIVNNEVSLLYIVAEPVKRHQHKLLDEEGLASVLEAGGKLSQKMKSFEPRPSQIAMTQDVSSVFNQGGILAAEAGTGVGKSFAYLVPALAWALGNDEKVVISTATINLQDQLFSKDLPLVSSIFRKKPKAVLIKGRGNYICRRRLSEVLEEEGLFLAEDSPIRKIASWDERGGSGDRADLSFHVDDSIWNTICSESDNCLSIRCPHRESCHIIKVRKDCADAQILIVNHHLLFADIASRKHSSGTEQTSILPAYNALVVDEAHSIESSATSLFTESFSRFGLYRKLARLSRKKRNREYGLLQRLSLIQEIDAKIIISIENLVKDSFAAFSDLEAMAIGLIRQENSLWIREKTDEVATSLCEPLGKVERNLLSITETLTAALASLPEMRAQDAVVLETQIALRSINELADTIAQFKDFETHKDTIFWIEKSRTSQKEIYITFNETPLSVATLLGASLFGKIRTVVCTSATLTVSESFDFWMKPIGIDRRREDVSTKIYSSPFPFSTNALLAIDQTAPNPQRNKEQFKAYVGDAVISLLKASRGRALVLFTSYELLASSFEQAKPVMESMGITCLRQGMDERSRLLTMFKNDISSVLFATDSFWEGIDAPGETLSMVIMTKLPFRVPSDPVQEARSQAVDAAGGNSFMEISVPEAIIKFKQGFGRLIRHSFDRGIVVTLDPRLVTARYGQLFVASLPHCRLLADGLPAIAKEVERFLDE
ncbi:MAG: ATP-dependent DNA helicase DinG [Spirochaetaceae bacterium]|nr:ATP-dependent DNA helicase DinG [Spirochaetaceae bacterium]